MRNIIPQSSDRTEEPCPICGHKHNSPPIWVSNDIYLIFCKTCQYPKIQIIRASSPDDAIDFHEPIVSGDKRTATFLTGCFAPVNLSTLTTATRLWCAREDIKIPAHLHTKAVWKREECDRIWAKIWAASPNSCDGKEGK